MWPSIPLARCRRWEYRQLAEAVRAVPREAYRIVREADPSRAQLPPQPARVASGYQRCPKTSRSFVYFELSASLSRKYPTVSLRRSGFFLLGGIWQCQQMPTNQRCILIALPPQAVYTVPPALYHLGLPWGLMSSVISSKPSSCKQKRYGDLPRNLGPKSIFFIALSLVTNRLRRLRAQAENSGAKSSKPTPMGSSFNAVLSPTHVETSNPRKHADADAPFRFLFATRFRGLLGFIADLVVGQEMLAVSPVMTLRC